MTTFSVGRRVTSFALLIAGIALLVFALVLDFLGLKFYIDLGNGNLDIRGAILVVGIILAIVGIYLFPTLKYHRTIVYGLFLFPLLATFLVTVIIPLFFGIGYSFTDWDGIRVRNVVGLENYVRMFRQPGFLWSILITFLFVFFNVILVNLIGFLLALLCTTKIKALGFFRASYFLPNLIGGIVLGYIWKFIFTSVLTNMLATKSMLSETPTAIAAIVIVYIWQYGGYIMLIYITGLTGVPADTLEAASIDGANPWQTLTKIKIPMIAPTITICTFLTLTSAFKQFDVNLAMTNGSGSIADFMGAYITNGTEMLALNIYSTAISQNQYALSQAKAVLFFIILAVVSIIQVRTSNKKEVTL
ncbi:MAG: sugar ABC transporter permease [Lachnospiraceae bacterium]|nr:sugar ABC transporter permease [Lachnospiraceae bacterium]